jgi:hypothetical protein
MDDLERHLELQSALEGVSRLIQLDTDVGSRRCVKQGVRFLFPGGPLLSSGLGLPPRLRHLFLYAAILTVYFWEPIPSVNVTLLLRDSYHGLLLIGCSTVAKGYYIAGTPIRLVVRRIEIIRYILCMYIDE